MAARTATAQRQTYITQQEWTQQMQRGDVREHGMRQRQAQAQEQHSRLETTQQHAASTTEAPMSVTLLQQHIDARCWSDVLHAIPPFLQQHDVMLPSHMLYGCITACTRHHAWHVLLTVMRHAHTQHTLDVTHAAYVMQKLNQQQQYQHTLDVMYMLPATLGGAATDTNTATGTVTDTDTDTDIATVTSTSTSTVTEAATDTVPATVAACDTAQHQQLLLCYSEALAAATALSRVPAIIRLLAPMSYVSCTCDVMRM